MFRTRATVVVLLMTVLFTIASSAAALPANLKAFAVIHGHTYSNGNHHASGKLRLVNSGSKDMTLNCTVTVTWARSNGDTAKRNDKITGAKVGAGQMRFLHFNVKFRDPDHLFENIPTHAAPHCFAT